MRSDKLPIKDRIIFVICKRYDVSCDDILRQVRTKHIAEARQVIMYCLRVVALMSFPEIGRLLGGRDHTTVMHACENMAEKIKNEKGLREEVNGIIASVITDHNDVSDKIDYIQEDFAKVQVTESSVTRKLSESEKSEGQGIKGGIHLEEYISKAASYDSVRSFVSDLGVSYSSFVSNYPEVAQAIRDNGKSKTKESIPSFRKYKIPHILELSEREKSFLNDYRGGKTFEEIGKNAGLTRERIRQIITKSILKEVGFRKKMGFEIDIDEYMKEVKNIHNLARWDIPENERKKLEEEYFSKVVNCTSVSDFANKIGIGIRKLERNFPEIVEIIDENKRKQKNRWSRYYVRCRGCGTLEIPHARRGYCERCCGNIRSHKLRASILGDNATCAMCRIHRDEAIERYKHDLYLTKDKGILCRECFLKFTGGKLAHSRETSGAISNREKITKRNLVLENAHCSICNISRNSAREKYGRDLYLMKDGIILCRNCFQQHTGSKLSSHKKLI